VGRAIALRGLCCPAQRIRPALIILALSENLTKRPIGADFSIFEFPIESVVLALGIIFKAPGFWTSQKPVEAATTRCHPRKHGKSKSLARNGKPKRAFPPNVVIF
jgi:hypothetical protein